jgi:hypothetical protein
MMLNKVGVKLFIRVRGVTKARLKAWFARPWRTMNREGVDYTLSQAEAWFAWPKRSMNSRFH